MQTANSIASSITDEGTAKVENGLLRERIQSGAVAYGAWCVSAAPFLAEVLALESFDYVTLDLQHGLFDYSSLVESLRGMARTRPTPTVRVPANDSSWIQRALDAGAEAIIVPMVETAEEAALAVKACRYFPEGNRSSGPIRSSLLIGSDLAAVNLRVICLVMVETAEGVSNVEEICSVPGVDGVYVGPSDLGITLGVGSGLALKPGPHLDAIGRIAKAARSHHKIAGIQCASSESASQLTELGYNMITLGSDASFMRAQVRRSLDAVGRAASAPVSHSSYS
jgi:4-hydroxy-2-oxoheptanedioate aldolase